MKIAIYDKWLETFGGGEKVATVMAEVLANAGHKVDLISNFEVDKKQLEKKMGVNLSKVNLKNWYEKRSYTKLTPKTKDYDLFINVSYLDHLPSMAEKSIYYVHFPTPIKNTFLGFIKYEAILPFFRKYLIIPEIAKGIDPIDDVNTRGGKWLSKENTIVLSNTPNKFKLTFRIYAEQLSLKTLELISFSSPNAKIMLRDKFIDHDSNILVYKLTVWSKEESLAIKITAKEDLRTNALGLVSMSVMNIRFFLWNVIKRYLPRYEMALYGSSIFKIEQGLDNYQIFLSNSNFTKKWTKKYWGKDSKILYPPVDTAHFKSGEKKNMILNVGRFFVGGHSKRQDILVSTFKKLIDNEKLDSSWSLFLVGGVAVGKEHADYVNKLKEESKGYPIHFYFSPSFNALKKIYSQAKIYWHATGFGVNENVEPIKVEHFGITPVEAMAAGAVPLVFKSGGVIETVNDDNLVWRSSEELMEKTIKLAKRPKLLQKYSQYVQNRAKKFSKENFAKSLLSYIEKLRR